MNHRFGTLAATMFNSHRQNKRDKWFKWTDFFNPFKARKARGLSQSEMLSQAQLMFQQQHEKR